MCQLLSAPRSYTSLLLLPLVSSLHFRRAHFHRNDKLPMVQGKMTERTCSLRAIYLEGIEPHLEFLLSRCVASRLLRLVSEERDQKVTPRGWPPNFWRFAGTKHENRRRFCSLASSSWRPRTFRRRRQQKKQPARTRALLPVACSMLPRDFKKNERTCCASFSRSMDISLVFLEIQLLHRWRQRVSFSTHFHRCVPREQKYVCMCIATQV